MTKTYNFGDLGVYKDTMPTLQEEIYQKHVDAYKEILDRQVTKLLTHQISTTPASITINTAAAPQPAYNWVTSINYDSLNTFKYAPHVSKDDKKVEVRLDDDNLEYISREELIKYIGERELIQQNEVVRKMYERYQVAVKLARSDDNGDTGV